MKSIAVSLMAFCLASPALAQQGATEIEVEGRALINRWIAAFNQGDAAAMLKTIYASGDEAGLVKRFEALRSDSFGKLDVYSGSFCGSDSAHGKALLKYGKLFTYGGLMDGDEATLFELVKTPDGWRIGQEARVPYDTVLTCS